MVKVGLTGGIGSGKTAVAAIFMVLGVPVFDADKQAKWIMENDAKLVLSIKKEFGEASYTNNTLNRALLAKIVFNDPYKLDILNSLVHPVTIAAADKWILAQTTPYVVKEAALLFESGSASSLDFIVGVHAPEDLRIKRVIDRDQVTRQQVLVRMQQQIDETIKMKLCDFVIINDEQQLLIGQILQLHEKLLDLAGEKRSSLT